MSTFLNLVDIIEVVHAASGKGSAEGKRMTIKLNKGKSTQLELLTKTKKDCLDWIKSINYAIEVETEPVRSVEMDMKGYLLKKGKHTSHKKKVMCAISGDTLVYSEKDKEKSINLANALITEIPSDKDSFEIQTTLEAPGGNRTYYFSATSEKDRKNWMAALIEASKATKDSVVLKKGSLEKKSITHKHGWQERYFILYPKYLVYYKSEKSARDNKKPLQINLVDIIVVAHATSGKGSADGTRMTIKLRKGKSTQLELLAKTKKECLDWIRLINYAIDSEKQQLDGDVDGKEKKNTNSEGSNNSIWEDWYFI